MLVVFEELIFLFLCEEKYFEVSDVGVFCFDSFIFFEVFFVILIVCVIVNKKLV